MLLLHIVVECLYSAEAKKRYPEWILFGISLLVILTLIFQPFLP